MADSAELQLKQLKKRAKAEKAARKKVKKTEKKSKKRAKKELKRQKKKEKKLKKLARKTGQPYVPPAPAGTQPKQMEIFDDDVVVAAEVTEDTNIYVPRAEITYVEAQVDRMTGYRGELLKSRWKEKYGEDFNVPEETLKARRVVRGPTPQVETGPAFEMPAQTEDQYVEKKSLIGGILSKVPVIGKKFSATKKKKVKAKKDKGAPVHAKAAGVEEKVPWWSLKCWILKNKLGEDTNKVKKLIFTIIDVVIWVLLLLPRIIITILMKIIGLVKKPKKDESTA